MIVNLFFLKIFFVSNEISGFSLLEVFYKKNKMVYSEIGRLYYIIIPMFCDSRQL